MNVMNEGKGWMGWMVWMVLVRATIVLLMSLASAAIIKSNPAGHAS